MPEKSVIVIGAGFAGLSTATCLADFGYRVDLLEKNSVPGGRARHFISDGFTFDMGPSWYWMPDVFDRYFQRFGKQTSDYYDLQRLDPSYQVVFGEDDFMKLPAGVDALGQLFEEYESGASAKLSQFLKQAEYKYQVGVNDLVYKPSLSITEFFDPSLLIDMFRMDLFSSIHSHVRKFFKHEKLIQLMEFPILFLGATAKNTPALYSLMNYADMALGTWYPKGGMYKIIEGMVNLAEEKGVNIHLSEPVLDVTLEGNRITGVVTEKNTYQTDTVVAACDYEHFDQKVLPKGLGNYSEKYWTNRTMAPSSLIFYLGLNKKIDNLLHHNLFFDADFNKHSHEIYEDPNWPEKPLFYVCAPSKTDRSVAPDGCENLFLLIPVAPGLDDNESIREKYYDLVMNRFESLIGQSIRDSVIYKRSYAHSDFISDYNAFRGNAYGLANTLKQTAILKPRIKNKNLNNLYYTGQLTVPGPGVPPSLISGQLVADYIFNSHKP